MMHPVTGIVARIALCALLAWSSALASPGKGPKIIEIDEAGRAHTTSGTDTGKATPNVTKSDEARAPVARDMNGAMSICNPRYRWSPAGLSADTIARARVFYRDVTQQYERAQTIARSKGTPLSRERENEYWNAYKRLMDSVRRNERKVVERGISPRLSWWCNAPPVVAKPVSPPPSPGNR